jgi:hypothetical protein
LLSYSMLSVPTHSEMRRPCHLTRRTARASALFNVSHEALDHIIFWSCGIGGSTVFVSLTNIVVRTIVLIQSCGAAALARFPAFAAACCSSSLPTTCSSCNKP